MEQILNIKTLEAERLAISERFLFLQKTIDSVDTITQYYKKHEGVDVEIVIRRIGETKIDDSIVVTPKLKVKDGAIEKRVSEILEKDKLQIEFLNNEPIKKEPKHPLEEVNENRQEVFKLIVKYNKSFTVKELQEFYKKENGTSSIKEDNFIMNSINKFYLNGHLRRYKFDVSPYRYGLTSWFQSGTLIKEQYR